MEINVLPTHRFVWTLLCIYPVDESVSKWKKRILKLFPLFSYISHLSLMAASAMFIIEFIWIDLALSSHAFAQFAAYSPMIFVLPIGIIRRQKIFDVFEKLREIHSKCK